MSTARATLRRFRRRLARDEHGGAVVLFAIAAPVVFGAAGLGVDVGLWYHSQRTVHSAADAAAVAGAIDRLYGGLDSVEAAAYAGAAENGFAPDARTTVLVRTPPEHGSHAGVPTAVEVLITRNERRLLSAVLSSEAVTVAARSVANVEFNGNACVLALDEAAVDGIGAGGNPDVFMHGCVLASNSNDDCAISVTGNAALAAYSLWTVGDYCFTGNELDLERPPITHAYPIEDPYADLEFEEVDDCLPGYETKQTLNSSTTIYPGVYCGGLQFNSQANIELKPGTYYIDQGEFRINGGAQVTCDCPSPEDGVTFILTSSGDASDIATININGSAGVELVAPSAPDDPLRGMLFIQDRRAPAGTTNTFNGGSSLENIRGAFYFPTQILEWTGTNDTGIPGCVQIVASKVVFSGNAEIDNEACEEGGVDTIPIIQVRLVE